MARDTLPPGTTPEDVDDRMGEPQTAAAVGSITVSVEAQVDPHATHQEVEEALLDELDVAGEVLDVEVVEVDG